MADAVIVSVAKGVITLIEAATLSQTFEPERSYADWELDLSKADSLHLRDSDKLHVDVASHTTEQAVERYTRGKNQFTVPIDIAIRRKFGQDKQNPDTGRVAVEEVDALILLLEELYLVFDNEEVISGATLDSVDIVAAPVREHLREMKQFTGIIRLTFTAYQTVA